MCGRFIVLAEEDRGELRAIFDEINRRYRNGPACSAGEIFPTQTPPVVTAEGPRPMYWGFPRQKGGVIINARCETVHTRSFFREAFAGCRCLVPASGFYEWRQTPDGKIRHLIRPAGRTLYMAGVYRPFRSLQDRGGAGFVILTAPAWPQMAPVHGRMPVLLDGAAPAVWLDSAAPRERLMQLFRSDPLPLEITPVPRGG